MRSVGSPVPHASIWPLTGAIVFHVLYRTTTSLFMWAGDGFPLSFCLTTTLVILGGARQDLCTILLTSALSFGRPLFGLNSMYPFTCREGFNLPAERLILLVAGGRIELPTYGL